MVFRQASIRLIEKMNHEAQQSGQVEMVMSEFKKKLKIEQILQSWVNVQTLDYFGWTALHLACKSSIEIFLYLVDDLQADLNATSKSGINLMHYAAFVNNTFIITYLRDKNGTCIATPDNVGNTPLHFACD